MSKTVPTENEYRAACETIRTFESQRAARIETEQQQRQQDAARGTERLVACRAIHESKLAEVIRNYVAMPTPEAALAICEVVTTGRTACAELGARLVLQSDGERDERDCVRLLSALAEAFRVPISGFPDLAEHAMCSWRGRALRHPLLTLAQRALDTNRAEDWQACLGSFAGYVDLYVVTDGRAKRLRSNDNGALMYEPWLREECERVYSDVQPAPKLSVSGVSPVRRVV